MNNKVWLLSDKGSLADDNCEHLYRYLRDKHPEITINYVLDTDSKDYERLYKEGFNLVSRNTSKFDEIYKKSGVLISSHLWKDVYRESENDTKRKMIFVPHGITLGDSSRYFNKGRFDLCTSCIQKEYESYISGKYGYNADKSVFKLTGMPRHDTLIKKNKKHKENKKKVISFVFTYRRPKYFKTYVDTLNSLFNCDYLKKLHKEYGITFQIKFHPYIVANGYENQFKLPKYIKDCMSMSYQDFLVSSDILISDYSSACQEFAVIGRNILYYQYDKDIFLSKNSIHSYDLGWFDWDKQALGKICLTQDELCDAIQNIIDNDYAVDEVYEKRMKKFFKYSDTKNCERVYKAIMKLVNIKITSTIVPTTSKTSEKEKPKKHHKHHHKKKEESSTTTTTTTTDTSDYINLNKSIEVETTHIYTYDKTISTESSTTDSSTSNFLSQIKSKVSSGDITIDSDGKFIFKT